MVTAVPGQLPHLQQQLVTDKDRQIALLEQELKVHKMMMEVERGGHSQGAGKGLQRWRC